MATWRAYACALAALLSAQTACAQAGVYALFTGAHLDPATAATTGVYGPTFGMYADFGTPFVKFGGDVRGALLTGGGTRNFYAVTGPRLEADLPVLSLKPYAEALAGGGDSIATPSSNPTLHIDYELLAGVDRPLNRLLEWRVLEFSYTHSINGAGELTTKALSTGLVLRIP